MHIHWISLFYVSNMACIKSMCLLSLFDFFPYPMIFKTWTVLIWIRSHWVSNFIVFSSPIVSSYLYNVNICDCDGNIYVLIAEQSVFISSLLRQQRSKYILRTSSTSITWTFLGMQILGPHLRLKEFKHLGVKSRNLYFKTSLGTLKCENHCPRGI